MQQWEYKIEDLGTWMHYGEETLNDVGRDGWELVGIYKEDGLWYAVFKQPI